MSARQNQRIEIRRPNFPVGDRPPETRVTLLHLQIGAPPVGIGLQKRITDPTIPPEKVFLRHELKDPQANYMCASACFFIFIGGTYRRIEPLFNDGNPVLILDKPYLADSTFRGMNDAQTLAATHQLKMWVDAYLEEMGVSLKYSDAMFSIPKDEVRWITSIDFNADLKGAVFSAVTLEDKLLQASDVCSGNRLQQHIGIPIWPIAALNFFDCTAWGYIRRQR
jgi:hypothetical protein